jgi:hypothetical protein
MNSPKTKCPIKAVVKISRFLLLAPTMQSPLADRAAHRIQSNAIKPALHVVTRYQCKQGK